MKNNIESLSGDYVNYFVEHLFQFDVMEFKALESN